MACKPSDLLGWLAGIPSAHVGWWLIGFGAVGLLGNALGGHVVDRSPLGAKLFKRGAISPVTLTLNTKQIDVDGKMIQLVPGMNLTAEIKAGQRRVIEYLLSPIQRAGSESLRER